MENYQHCLQWISQCKMKLLTLKMSNKFCQSTNGNIFSSELSIMKSISSQKILNTFLVCIVCIEHIQIHITILRFFNNYENFPFSGCTGPTHSKQSWARRNSRLFRIKQFSQPCLVSMPAYLIISGMPHAFHCCHVAWLQNKKSFRKPKTEFQTEKVLIGEGM